ncbi:MAG: hypothetical protein KDD99_11940 [Bacteroidetes bacterium]|nr:hypothetical protein [Bacteroidota bacterium]
MKHSYYILVFIIIFLVNAGIADEMPQPFFDNAAEITTRSGYQRLSWGVDGMAQMSEPPKFELQQSLSPQFASSAHIYSGADRATFLSGLKDGDYYYRVRVIDPQNNTMGPWSESISIKVRHHSLTLAFTLFAIGAVILLFTVLIVVKGVRNTQIEN